MTTVEEAVQRSPEREALYERIRVGVMERDEARRRGRVKEAEAAQSRIDAALDGLLEVRG
jgi:hypothetical protein